MDSEIKKRIAQIRRGEVPEGYKKTKYGILPADWTVYIPVSYTHLAGIGSDVFESWEEAVGSIQVMRSYEPDLNRSVLYEKQYQKYLRLTETLGPLMHKESGKIERSR